MNLIAEISSNHNNDIDRVKRLIDLAVKYDFHSVKFQLFKINQLFSSEILERSQMHRDRVKWELPESFIEQIYDYSKKKNILVGYSPFYLEAIEKLNDFTDYFKIASYELLWKDLFEKIIETGKPIMVSTGMATIEEIRISLNAIPRNYPLTLFHCSSAYPTSAEYSNLASISCLRDLLLDMKFNNFHIGWSDHTKIPAIVSRAFHKYDATFAEIHIDLNDKKGFEFGAGHCWIEDEIKILHSATKYGTICDGQKVKTYNIEEEADRLWRTDPRDGLRPFQEIRKDFKASDS